MKDFRKGRAYPLLLALAAAGLLTCLAWAGLLDGADRTASDAWYRDFQTTEGDVVLVGIDQRALEEIGPYEEWGRDIMAMAVEYLNESEDCHPAAIALDVLYIGERDPDADAWLAEAAAEYGNVITGCAAQFQDAFVEQAGGGFYRDRFTIAAFEEPYEALREVVTEGHINVMLDTDGVLRHHLLSYQLEDGREIPSMALAAATKFREFHGLDPITLPPVDSNGFWYVPFCGAPGDMSESISVADLLTGEVPADYFAGKVVFIGPYAPGLQDTYVTAADHAQPMYGVEYQANAVQALLWGNYPQERKEAGGPGERRQPLLRCHRAPEGR